MADPADPPRLFAPAPLATALAAYLPIVLLNRAVGFARGWVLAWLFADAAGAFGLAAWGLQAVNVLLVLAGLGLPDAVARFAPAARHAGQLAPFLRRWVGGGVLLAVAIGALGVAFAGPLAALLFGLATPDALALTRLVLAATVAHVLYLLVQSALRGLGLARALMTLETLHTVGFAVLALAGAVVIAPTAPVILWAYLLALLVPAVLLAVNAWRARDATAPPADAPAPPPDGVWPFALAATAAALLWQALLALPDWYVLRTLGDAAVGSVAAFRQFAQVPALLAVAVASLLAAEVLRRWEAGARDTALDLWTSVTTRTMLALTAGGVGLVLLAPLVARVLPASFGPGLAIWGPALTGYLLMGHLALLAIRAHAVRRPLLAGGAYAAGALVTAALLAPLTARAGLSGAVLAGTAGLAVATVLLAALLTRVGPALPARWWASAALAPACLLLAWLLPT